MCIRDSLIYLGCEFDYEKMATPKSFDPYACYVREKGDGKTTISITHISVDITNGTITTEAAFAFANWSYRRIR